MCCVNVWEDSREVQREVSHLVEHAVYILGGGGGGGGIGRRFEKEMKVNGWGSLKLAEGRNPWQWVKHAWLYSDVLQALKRDFFFSSGFSTDIKWSFEDT